MYRGSGDSIIYRNNSSNNNNLHYENLDVAKRSLIGRQRRPTYMRINIAVK